MSINQSRAKKIDYRKMGRSGSYGQPRNFSGGGGKGDGDGGGGGGGGGPTPPPSSSSLSSKRSFKKPNYAQGGQSRVTSVSVNSDTCNTSAARAVQSGASLQPPLQGASDAPATGITIKPIDGPTQKSTRTVPKASSSHPATVSSDTTAPLTPVKDPGDVPRSFPLQFGSISPGFMNGMQVPARTSSVPPNLDEQKHDQARHDSFRAVPTLPIPFTSKQQLPKKNVGDVGQSNPGEAHPMPHAKRDVQVSSVPRPQKPCVPPFTGSSMQMPFHQPMQFGGPNQQMHSQGITATSMPLPMQMMPLPIGNHQVPQQVFVPSLQSHMMLPQGIVHQGQSLGFSSQMGPHLPPHMGNLGVSTTPQFPQQQAGIFGVCRKTVKITHPDTHEELRLDKRTDSYNVPPQSQPIPSFPPDHPINFYPNSYNAGSHFFPPSSSIPLTSTQINPSSQSPRFSYPISQSPRTGTFVNPSALNTFSVNKGMLHSHGIADLLNLEYARDVEKVILSASGSYGEKVAHESSKLPKPHVEAGLNTPERDSSLTSTSKDIILESNKGKKIKEIRGKKKRKEILQKADAVRSTSALYMASKGPEENKVAHESSKLPKPHVEAVLNTPERDSSLTSTSKDRMLESNKGKSNTAKGKKKRKEFLQKADAARTTSNLYMAYKGPEENKEIVFASSESIESTSSNNFQPISIDASVDVSSEKVEQSKAEPDDWEDAADVSTPELETSETVKLLHEDVCEVMAKRYSRDFLLKFAEQCTDLPEVFVITSHIEAFMVSSVTVSRKSLPSPGRIVDRPTGGSRPDRRRRGTGDEDKWSKFSGPVSSVHDMRLDIGYGGNLVGFVPGQGGNRCVLRNLGPQTPVQYSGDILSGPMHRNNADSDLWQCMTGFDKGLIPSPQTPLLVIDEEQAKQRQLAILNNLSPQNFERLFEQVKAVNIDNAVTLTGVISQIFDIALTEPTFCEMYANFCFHLAGELPDFNADNEKITFKRLLLNKYPEEFERGEREQKEANRAEEEGEAKQSEQEQEERRTQVRRLLLGNIRMIGELYKKKMLTERIMHACIKKLLGQYQTPDEEDIEALCKLMSTIGEMIDHPKAKEHMDAYFDIMANLSNNMNLSSTVRFMLKDAIDLRKYRWQQRGKVEGPKETEEVYRDVAQERNAQGSRLAHGPGSISSV